MADETKRDVPEPVAPGRHSRECYDLELSELRALREQVERSFRIPLTEANARLIAAAPELLEACKGMLAVLEDGAARMGGWKGAFADSVRAAIAKATGGKP